MNDHDALKYTDNYSILLKNDVIKKSRNRVTIDCSSLGNESLNRKRNNTIPSKFISSNLSNDQNKKNRYSLNDMITYDITRNNDIKMFKELLPNLSNIVAGCLTDVTDFEYNNKQRNESTRNQRQSIESIQKTEIKTKMTSILNKKITKGTFKIMLDLKPICEITSLTLKANNNEKKSVNKKLRLNSIEEIKKDPKHVADG